MRLLFFLHCLCVVLSEPGQAWGEHAAPRRHPPLYSLCCRHFDAVFCVWFFFPRLDKESVLKRHIIDNMCGALSAVFFLLLNHGITESFMWNCNLAAYRDG